MKKHTFESCFFRCYLGQHEEREGRGSCSSRGSLPLSLCLSLVNLGLESPVRIFLFLETSERLRGASAESAGPPLFPPEGASSLSPSLRICLSRREETRRLTCEAKQENRVEKKPLILLEKVFAEKAKKKKEKTEKAKFEPGDPTQLSYSVRRLVLPISKRLRGTFREGEVSAAEGGRKGSRKRVRAITKKQLRDERNLSRARHHQPQRSRDGMVQTEKRPLAPEQLALEPAPFGTRRFASESRRVKREGGRVGLRPRCLSLSSPVSRAPPLRAFARCRDRKPPMFQPRPYLPHFPPPPLPLIPSPLCPRATGAREKPLYPPHEAAALP